MTVVVYNGRLSVMRSRSRCMAMYYRSRMVYDRLRHVTASVEARVTMAVAAPVGNILVRALYFFSLTSRNNYTLIIINNRIGPNSDISFYICSIY